MKIALPSDDGRTISPHFGRSAGFLVLTVQDGRILEREVRAAGDVREKADGACRSGAGADHDCAERLSLIKDCGAVVCRGMGPRAAQALLTAGLRPFVLTSEMEPEVAALACAAGRLAAGMPGAGCGCHTDRDRGK